MRHVAAGLERRVCWFLIALAVGALSCGGVRTDGLLIDGGAPPRPSADARPVGFDTRAGDAGAISMPLPGAAGKSAAFWTCSGGAAFSGENGQLGVAVGGLSG